MNQLTHTDDNGVTYAYDPLTSQWSASAEGRKSATSQSLQSLQDRVQKWTAPPSKKARPPDQELASVGLAGIPYSPNSSIPNLKATGLLGKLAWEEQGATLVRYRESPKDSWQSARLTTQLLDPRTFEADDHAFWAAVALTHHGEAVIDAAEKKLAAAWGQHTPVDTQIIHFTGRLGAKTLDPKHPYAQSSPIVWKEMAVAPKSENRNYAATSSAWPVLVAPSEFKPNDEEMAKWPTQSDGSLQHASGVKVVMSKVFSLHADFKVLRPDGQGNLQCVYTGDSFFTAFRLAQFTVKINNQALPEVSQWQASSNLWSKDGFHPVSWPSLVKTQAMGLMFTKDKYHDQYTIEPFVLQTLKQSNRHSLRHSLAETSAPLADLVWKSVSRQPDVVYLTPGPSDVLLDQLSSLRDWTSKTQQALESVLNTWSVRSNRLHNAALNQAYNDVADGDSCEPAAALQRLNHYFDRITRAAAATPEARALDQTIAAMRFEVEPASVSKPVRSRRSPG
jgi:hypothetical protein